MREGISTFNSDILRFGDLDKDGFDDLMVTLEQKDTRKKHLFLYKSEECSEELINEMKIELKEDEEFVCRYFNPDPLNDASSLMRDPDSFMTTHFDFGEYG